MSYKQDVLPLCFTPCFKMCERKSLHQPLLGKSNLVLHIVLKSGNPQRLCCTKNINE